MTDASPSLGGHPAARLPQFAVADRATAERPPHQHGSDRLPADTAPAATVSPSPDPTDYSGLTDGPADAAAASEVDARRWGYERGGYGGMAPTLSAARDGADLNDLSHSLGDGARYAVDIGHARGQAETPAGRAAKLRLRQALYGVRRVCEQAMRQRMHTEMADLASQIRKMHDRDNLPR